MRWFAVVSFIPVLLVANVAAEQATQVVFGEPSQDDGLRRFVGGTRQQRHVIDSNQTLRQIHHRGTGNFERVHRYVNVTSSYVRQLVDDTGESMLTDEKALQAQDIIITVERPSTLEDDQYESLQARSPNITDKQTVLSFAKMAADAYARKDNNSDLDWQDVGSGFNYTIDYGWESDGLRGHVFADETNQTIVISIKGTSVPWLDDPATKLRDLQNDNLFGSCCCGQGGSLWWTKVCNCKSDGYTCNSTCLTSAFHSRTSYYWAALELYYNVTKFYPGADVWMTGHSLGGVVSALLGLKFGLPTLTFEAYPDALAAARLGLPTPPGYNIGVPQPSILRTSHIHHFGHTADPIYMGECGTDFSSCSWWGYAFESKCHTGQRHVYDTQKDLGWGSSVRTHSIIRVIKEVLAVYDGVPAGLRDRNCMDCTQWTFF